MPSSRKMIVVRPSDQEMEAITAAATSSPHLSLAHFMLATVMAEIQRDPAPPSVQSDPLAGYFFSRSKGSVWCKHCTHHLDRHTEMLCPRVDTSDIHEIQDLPDTVTRGKFLGKTVTTFFDESLERAKKLDKGELLAPSIGTSTEVDDPDPLLEREFASKLRTEFPSQHEHCLTQKRFRDYKKWTNQERYEYHIKMREEAGE